MVDIDIRNRITEKPGIAAVFTVFLISQLIILSATLYNPPIWDSAIYIGMGKYLYSMGEIGLWETFRPPFLPILFGALWKIGLPPVATSRILGLTLSVLGLYSLYYGIRRLSTKETALYSTAIMLSSYMLVAKSTMLLTGIPSALMLFTAVWLFQEERQVLGGIMLAFAFLTRFPAAIGGPIIVAFSLYQGWRNEDIKKAVYNSAIFSAAFGVVVAPYLILNQIYLGSFLQPFINAVKVPAAAGSSYNFGLYFLIEAFKINPLLVLSIPGLYFVLRKKEVKYFLSSVLLIVIYGFFTVFPHKEPRYILLFLPFMAFLAGRAVKELSEYKISEYIEINHFQWAFVILVSLMIGLFSFGAYQINNHVNEDAKQFYNQHSDLKGFVASNHPEVMVYGDVKFKGLPPSYLPGLYENLKTEADYFSINSCAWYCTPSMDKCQETIDRFTTNLSENFPKHYELEGDYCNYTIYEVKYN